VSDPRPCRNQAMTDASRAAAELFSDSGHTDFTVTDLVRHESEAGWARVIALRIGIDPNSQRAALIGAVAAAARLSTKSFVDSGADVDPARTFAANLELLGDELFAGPSPTTIKKAGTRS
jgi:hypothetical protein